MMFYVTLLHKTSPIKIINVYGRLMFPLDAEGSLVIIITPCATPLVWTLSLRSRHDFDGASEAMVRSASNHSFRTAEDPKPSEGEMRSSSPRRPQDLLAREMEVPILRDAHKTEEDRGMLPVKDYRIESGGYKEVVLKEYEGHEAVVFQEQNAMIGLYVVQVSFIKCF